MKRDVRKNGNILAQMVILPPATYKRTGVKRIVRIRFASELRARMEQYSHKKEPHSFEII